MANNYILRYLPVAVDNLISIFGWIANDSPANAAAFVDKLDQCLGNLETHPTQYAIILSLLSGKQNKKPIPLCEKWGFCDSAHFCSSKI